MTVQTKTETTSATTWMCFLFTCNWLVSSKANSHCFVQKYKLWKFWSHGTKIIFPPSWTFLIRKYLKYLIFFQCLYYQWKGVSNQQFVSVCWFNSMMETNYRANCNRDNDSWNYSRLEEASHLQYFLSQIYPFWGTYTLYMWDVTMHWYGINLKSNCYLNW